MVACTAVVADEISEKQESLIGPVVRVTYGGGGGSGTVIYSDDRDKEGRFVTMVLTNNHVISDAIRIERKWNSLKGKYENVEERDRVKVETFVYDEGRVIATQDYEADIVAHTEAHDLAVLRLYYPREVSPVATLLPAGDPLRLFQPVYAVGCSLLHEPIATHGEITDLDDMIDGKTYTMMSAQIIFGNSGGAVFTKSGGRWFLIGVPSRVAVSHGSAVTHMGWFIPASRINQWIGEQILTFLTDGGRTPRQCFDERAKLLDPSGAGPAGTARNISPYDFDGRSGKVPAVARPDPSKVYGPRAPGDK